MLGAVQMGALAACVVLFVPMAMAGFHLSRNKMLFFSASLFITLAVFVHLTPYFPLLFLNNNNHNSDNNNNNNNLDSDSYNNESCITHLHNVQFDLQSNPKVVNFRVGQSITGEKIGSWGWADSTTVNACGFQKLGRPDSCDLLNGSWVVVAGDSQARLLSVSLLGLVLGEQRMGSVRGDLFKRHSDYHIEIGEIGVRFDFVWAPYVENLTGLVSGFGENGSYPDVLVMGVGLWHMLHVADPSDYGFSLRKLRTVVSLGSLHVFWLGMPTLINSMLNTEEKREKMNDSARERYDGELYASKLLRGSGGTLFMIDVGMLSRRCGRRCTVDGMHYDDIVYEAAVHILLNALLIESHQRLS